MSPCCRRFDLVPSPAGSRPAPPSPLVNTAFGPYVRCPYCDNIIVRLNECTSCHHSLIGVRCLQP